MIRPVQPAEFEAVAALWLRASLGAHDFIPAAYWRARVTELREVYLPLSDELIGWFDDETGALAAFMALTGDFLAALFVDPARQGQGIGSRLLTLATRMHPALTLSVYAANTRAVAFYRRHGFTRQETRLEAATGQPEWVLARGLPRADGSGAQRGGRLNAPDNGR